MNDRYTIQYAQIKFYIREHRLQVKFITSYRPILSDVFVMIFVFDSPIYFFLAEGKEKQPLLLLFFVLSKKYFLSLLQLHFRVNYS